MGDDPAAAPPANPGPSDEPRRTVDATFILALIFGLRARGLPTGPGDAAAAAALSALQADWSHDELAAVLSPVFVRRPGEAAVFAEVFRRLFDERPAPEAPVPRAPERQPEKRKTSDRRVQPPPSRWRAWASDAVRRAGAAVSKLTPYWWQAVLIASAAILVLTLAAGDYDFVPNSRREPCGPSNSCETSLSSWLYGGAWATVVVILGLLAWSGYVSRRSVALAPQRGPEPEPSELVPGDGTVFRVGAIGRRAEPFIRPPALAAEIAEIFGYRPGEPDPSRLDARRSIAARLRGEDPAQIHFIPRRELPTVLLLIDSSSEARFWNTLPNEFANTLLARGVALDRIDFPGSFFLRRGQQSLARPEAAFVETAMLAAGWTVTIVFAEAHRLFERDIALLRRVLENGPVLFLELRDPALWDERQLRLQDIGAIVMPATGPHLRDGLALLFAPDRLAAPPAALPTAPPGEVGSGGLAERLGDALAWAAECALIQPVSFGLAERLRGRHPKLVPHDLAFSRLTALPGGFLGPEGLRFATATRRALLGHFAQRPPAQRKAVIELIGAAIELVPAKGITAAALRRYTHAQIRLFDVTPDGGLREIFALKEDGLIDPDPIRDMIGRLRPPDYPDRAFPDEIEAPLRGAEPIRLPAEPFSAVARLQIAGLDGGYETARQRVVPADWAIATPEVRLRVRAAERSMLVAAFLPGANEILCEGSPAEGESILLLINAANATQERITVPASGDVRCIAVAEAAPVAAVWIRADVVRVLRLDESSDSGQRQAPLEVDLGGWASDFAKPASVAPLLALAPDGGTLALRGPSGQQLRVLDPATGSLRIDDLPLEGIVESLVFIDGASAIAGLRDGRLLRVGFGETADKSPSLIAKVDGVPTSLGLLRGEGNSYALLIALDGGRIMIIPNDRGSPAASSPEELARVDMTPVGISVCLPVEDRAAARIETFDVSTQTEKSVNSSIDSSMQADKGVISASARIKSIDASTQTEKSVISLEGICIAVLGSRGEFDIVGVPRNASGHMLTRPSDISASAPPSASLSSIPVFSPMSLLRRPIGPAIDGSHVIAAASGGRRLAALRGGRLEIRPLTYALAKPAEPSRAEAAPEAAAEPSAEQSVPA